MGIRSSKETKEDNEFLENLKKQMPADMPAQRILAIVSQFVGQLIALQDKRTMTPDMAMKVVVTNIEIGNQAALLTIGDTEGEA